MLEQQVMESSPETKRKRRKNNGIANDTKEDNADDTCWWHMLMIHADDTCKCKSCHEIWHGKDEPGNRW